MNKYLQEIQEELFLLRDEQYKNFQCKLMPEVKSESVLGIRVPKLRIMANELKNTLKAECFLNALPHKYYDENNLHAFLIEKITDYDECIQRLNEFFPYINDWSTCDCMSPKVLKKQKEKTLENAYLWMQSPYVFGIRFGIKVLMNYYLDDLFDRSQAEKVAQIKSNEYYINMMRAWYFATALAKQQEQILPFFEQFKLDAWTHNKAISKARESFRVDGECKEYLKTLKIK